MTMIEHMSSAAVPARYHGLWRRELLAAPGLHDTATTVFWLQAPHWHADLRMPPGRPDFSGVASLAACSPAQRAWLATQQGFAGITLVRADGGRELCSWRRLLDRQPPQDAPDEGWMDFEADLLVETGVHAPYLEHWRRLPGTGERIAVLRAPGQMLFLAGNWVMHLAWPEQDAASAPPAGLDLAISLGRREVDGADGADRYLILHSTMPWLEGRRGCLPRLGAGCAWQVMDSKDDTAET